jgi:hypothetical protein
MRPADSFPDPPDRDSGTAPGAPASGGETPPSISAEAFSRALRAAIATGAIEAAALRSSLHSFVDDLRGRGEPPERALIAVKERVLLAAQRRPDVDRSETGVLLRQIVHWTIEEYFRAD